MEKMFIKPARAGNVVRDPFALMQLLPADGAWKPRDSYWTRRLIAGDVVETTPPADEPVAAPQADEPAAAK